MEKNPADVRIALLLTLILVFAGVLSGCPSRENLKRADSNKRGEITSIYQMSLPQVGGVEFPLSALRGKVVLVDFFASFCTPCLVIIPKLKKLYKTYRSRGFLVIGIALENQVEKVLIPYVRFLKIDYPVLVADRAIYRGKTPFGWVLKIPRSYLIDRCGNIRKIYTGVIDEKIFQREIESLLREEKCKTQ